MADSETKRVRRTPEERAAEIDSKIGVINQSIEELEAKKQAAIASFDEKIAAAQERIKVLEGKKQEILAPKPPRKPRKTKKQKIQEILKEAQKNGMEYPDTGQLQRRGALPRSGEGKDHRIGTYHRGGRRKHQVSGHRKRQTGVRSAVRRI